MNATTYPVSFDLNRPDTMSRAHVFLRIVLLILVSWIVGSGGGIGLVYLGVPVVAATLIARKSGDRYLIEDGARVTGWLAFIVGILAYLALLTDELPGGTRQPVHLEIVRSGSPTVGSALWRILKAIPSALALFLISLISSIVSLIAGMKTPLLSSTSCPFVPTSGSWTSILSPASSRTSTAARWARPSCPGAG